MKIAYYTKLKLHVTEKFKLLNEWISATLHVCLKIMCQHTARNSRHMIFSTCSAFQSNSNVKISNYFGSQFTVKYITLAISPLKRCILGLQWSHCDFGKHVHEHATMNRVCVHQSSVHALHAAWHSLDLMRPWPEALAWYYLVLICCAKQSAAESEWNILIQSSSHRRTVILSLSTSPHEHSNYNLPFSNLSWGDPVQLTGC